MPQNINSLTKRFTNHKEIITNALAEYAPLSQYYYSLYGRYMGLREYTPILAEPIDEEARADIRVATNFYRDVVKTKTGYMGSSISVKYKKDDERAQDLLNKITLLNNETDLDSTTVRDITMMGPSYRLLYIKEGDVRMKNLYPWEVIYIIGNGTKYDPDMVLWYYKDYDTEGEKTFVELYDRENYYKYKEGGNNGWELLDSKFHLFKRVPIIPFYNNEEGVADGVNVLSLIDSYDKTLSNAVSLLQKQVDTFLVLKGDNLKVDDTLLDTLEKWGILLLGPEDSAQFAERNIPDEPVMNQLKTLRRNIYTIANSIDYSDEDFNGNIPVVAFKQKISRLENSSKETERKFQSSLREMYSLIADYYGRKRQPTFSPYDLEFNFARNYPKNIKEETETLAMLVNLVSRKDAYNQVSFIDNPDEWVERFEEEQDEYTELYAQSIEGEIEETIVEPEDRGSGE